MPDRSATDRSSPESPVGYPTGNESRDAVIELLCDEWPYEVDYREWDDRCALVVRLLDVLDRNRLRIISADTFILDEVREIPCAPLDWEEVTIGDAGARSATSASVGQAPAAPSEGGK